MAKILFPIMVKIHRAAYYYNIRVQDSVQQKQIYGTPL